MYKLNVISHFSSAHQLKGYNGPCKNVHGHNWKVRVGIICEEINKIGLTIDFSIVKKHLKDIIDKLDHTFLNELNYFRNNNPTSENISKYIFDYLKNKIDNNKCKIAEVEVWESEKTSIMYYE